MSGRFSPENSGEMSSTPASVLAALASLFAGRPWIGHAEAARFLDVTESTLIREGDERAIVFRLKATKRMYVVEDIADYLAEREEAYRRKPQPGEGTIYFVKCASFVKIGFTRSLSTRLETLAMGLPECPVLLLSKPGNVREERRLHAKFQAYRTHREWFRLEGELAAYIEARAE